MRESIETKLKIIQFNQTHLDIVFDIQKRAFFPLYKKYEDIETNPYCESKEIIRSKYSRRDTDGYLFLYANKFVGCVRIIKKHFTCKISALAVLPEYQNKGIAQTALLQIENNYPHIRTWKLATIKQEQGNCHLYEILGYKTTGHEKSIKNGFTIIEYMKKKL